MPHPLFPRIHIVVSRDVTAFRAAAGDRFSIEARIQRHYGGAWALAGLRFAKTAGEAREVARVMATSFARTHKPGSPVEISHGGRFGFGAAHGDARGHGTAYVRKTEDLWVVQSNYGYGHGWEDSTAETTREEGKKRLREYRDNSPGLHRLIKRRVKIGAHASRRMTRRTRRR